MRVAERFNYQSWALDEARGRLLQSKDQTIAGDVVLAWSAKNTHPKS